MDRKIPVHNASLPIRLQIPLQPAMLNLAMSFSEQAGLSLGLGRPEAMKLALAAEEVFAYLVRHAALDREVVLVAVPGGYYVELRVEISTQSVPLGVFNLTSSPLLDDEAGLEQLGLLIASRSVDHFRVALAGGDRVSLVFRKRKVYPKTETTGATTATPLGKFTVVTPEPQRGKHLSRLLTSHYPGYRYPSAFAAPGRMVDALAFGDFQCSCAADAMGGIGGFMVWRRLSSHAVEAYGPYIFGQPLGTAMAEALLEDCLNRLARSDATSLIFRYPTEELPAGYCERLGDLEGVDAQGRVTILPQFYRQLHEDQGAQVWTHPCLEEFLRGEYRRLYLPRHLEVTATEGEARPDESLIGVYMDRSIGWVFLKPLMDGRDFPSNLAAHLRRLRGDGLRNIIFRLDLGLPWSADLAPTLLEQGFTPRLILPLGGRSDLLTLQHATPAS